jgi:soluble lytic murein transglycosylase-like protein
MSKKTIILIALLVLPVRFASAQSCYYYFYYTDSQQYIKAPTNMPKLGRFVDKQERDCTRSDGLKASKYLTRSEYESLAIKTGKKYSVDPDLILAVIKAESFFDTNAVSKKGAKGLMQVMDFNFASLGITDPFNPKQNVDGGTKYLKELLDLYKGDLDLALAGYNAGRGAVEKHGGVPPYQETIKYIAKVKRYFNELKSS